MDLSEVLAEAVHLQETGVHAPVDPRRLALVARDVVLVAARVVDHHSQGKTSLDRISTTFHSWGSRP